MEITKLFLFYGSRKIALSSITLNRFQYNEKKTGIAEKIIDEVFLYLDKEDGAYKDYEKLRNLV